jgi:hypothetical protein
MSAVQNTCLFLVPAAGLQQNPEEIEDIRTIETLEPGFGS